MRINYTLKILNLTILIYLFKFMHEGEYKVRNTKKARPKWIQAPESFHKGVYRTESDMLCLEYSCGNS